MRLDKNAIDRLLSLSDGQLKFVITKLGVENGLDLSSFNISSNDINSIRNALHKATDADIERAVEQLARGRRGGK